MSEMDLVSLDFSKEEVQQFDEFLNSAETFLKGRTKDLNAEGRKRFGRIAETNKLFVNKSKVYMDKYPSLVPSMLNKAEFDKDFKAREIIESWIIRLQGLTEQLVDTKILLDNDNYRNSLTFYRHIRFLSQEGVSGTTSILQDLGQFFNRGKKRQKPEEVAPENKS